MVTPVKITAPYFSASFPVVEAPKMDTGDHGPVASTGGLPAR